MSTTLTYLLQKKYRYVCMMFSNCHSRKWFVGTPTTAQPRSVSSPTGIRSDNLKCTRYVCMMLLVVLPSIVYCQQENEFDEISITFNVQRIGSCEIPAIIHNETAYLPLKEVFDFLKIKNSFGTNMDSIEGFFIYPKDLYVIDKVNNKIKFQDKIFDLKPTDLIRTETGLYLKSDYLGDVFGLTCSFNFRSLSVTMNTKAELPAIREMQLEQMHKNIVLLKGEKKADTTIKRKYPLFHLGMADWSVINTKEITGNGFTRIGLNLGAIVAGGETNVYLNYNSTERFDVNKQYWMWKLVNNSSSTVRQVIVGNIFPQATSSIYGAVTGVQVSNTPTTYRKSFGTYRLSNKTEPGWLVELYVNNVMVNYTKADASGFYTFDVPLVYGNSSIKVRFYGPWGEERSKEENISIPFNFLPLHQLEYTATAGIVDDEQKSKLARLNINYGLGTHITVGGGIEYLSTVTSGKSMPFLTASVRLGSNLLVSGEHTYGVRSKGVITYRLPSNFLFEANYIKYEKGQTAIRSGLKSFNNYLEERKVVFSMPFRTKKIVAFSRFSFNQLLLTNMKYTTAEFVLSAMTAGINTNFTTSVVYSDPKNPLTYTNFSIGLRATKGIRITPQIQYEYKVKNFSMLKCELEKNLFNKGFMNISYEKNIAHQTHYFTAGIRYNFSFAQTSVSITKSNEATSTIQSARGSLLYNDKSQTLRFKNQSSVGRGGLVMVAFLDMNNNGVHDKDEPKLPGLKLRINGGNVVHNKRDTSLSITGLEAYNNYYIELDRNCFDNVAWQIKKSTMNVSIEPNHFKLIEVPVAVMGEVSGTVYLKNDKGESGLGRIIVNIYDSNSNLIAHTLSEPDGYFTFAGLLPGHYSATIDTAQLLKLNMTSTQPLSFTIKLTKEGDIADGLKFKLRNNK